MSDFCIWPNNTFKSRCSVFSFNTQFYVVYSTRKIFWGLALAGNFTTKHWQWRSQKEHPGSWHWSRGLACRSCVAISVYDEHSLTVSTSIDCCQTGIFFLQSVQIAHDCHLRKRYGWIQPLNSDRGEIGLVVLVKTHLYRTVLKDCFNIFSYTRCCHTLRVRAANVPTNISTHKKTLLSCCRQEVVFKANRVCFNLKPSALQGSGQLHNVFSLLLILHPDAQRGDFIKGRLEFSHLQRLRRHNELFLDMKLT